MQRVRLNYYISYLLPLYANLTTSGRLMIWLFVFPDMVLPPPRSKQKYSPEYDTIYYSISPYSYCKHITNASVVALVHSLPSLKQLRINCCKQISTRLLDAMPLDKNLLVIASFKNSSHAEPTVHHFNSLGMVIE